MYQNQERALQAIPREIKNPNDKAKTLYLLGVIEHRSAKELRRTQNEEEIEHMKQLVGHYVTYVYRRGDSLWELYDDLYKKTKRISKMRKIRPCIIVYINTATIDI